MQGVWDGSTIFKRFVEVKVIRFPLTKCFPLNWKRYLLEFGKGKLGSEGLAVRKREGILGLHKENRIHETKCSGKVSN